MVIFSIPWIFKLNFLEKLIFKLKKNCIFHSFYLFSNNFGIIFRNNEIHSWNFTSIEKFFWNFILLSKWKFWKYFIFTLYIYSLIPSSSFIFLYSWLNILVSFKLHLFKQLIFHSILDRDYLFPSAVRKNSIKDVQIIRDSSPFHLPWSRNEFL